MSENISEPQRLDPKALEPASWAKAELTGWDDAKTASSAKAYVRACAGITRDKGLEQRARDPDLAATSSCTSATREVHSEALRRGRSLWLTKPGLETAPRSLRIKERARVRADLINEVSQPS